MISPVRARLAQLCYLLGLTLAVYLALLKFFALPCLGPGSCQHVLHSSFGTVYGLPVGLFGALIWLGILYVPDRTKRAILLFMLSVGCGGFMLIQFYALRSFCLWCTLHALCAWAAFGLRATPPHRSIAFLSLLLAGGGFLATRHYAATHIAQLTPYNARPEWLRIHRSSLHWLSQPGKVSPDSPALVLSLDCPACLDLLENITRHSFTDIIHGPSIYFKTTPANRALTLTFVSAVLAQDASPRDAFLAASSLLLTRKDLALTAPDAAAAQLAALFPSAPTRLELATRIIDDQAAAISSAHLTDTTPLLLPLHAPARAFFETADLFPTAIPAATPVSASPTH